MLDVEAEEVRERYGRRHAEYGYDPRTLGWNVGSQRVRFEALLEGLRDDDYAAILDVGCGFGDLLDFLRARGWQGRYTGIDLVPELVAEARRRHEGDGAATFACTEITAIPRQEQSAMAVAIGIFNHRLHRDNMEFVRGMLAALWASSTEVVVCDFLSTTSETNRRRDDLFYADPGVMLTEAHRYSRRAMIHHAYMPFEFQVKIWHRDGFAEGAPIFAPYLDADEGAPRTP
jgi:SAM-dependent methyltransferase